MYLIVLFFAPLEVSICIVFLSCFKFQQIIIIWDDVSVKSGQVNICAYACVSVHACTVMF